jgi:hypothetical protein
MKMDSFWRAALGFAPVLRRPKMHAKAVQYPAYEHTVSMHPVARPELRIASADLSIRSIRTGPELFPTTAFIVSNTSPLRNREPCD